MNPHNHSFQRQDNGDLVCTHPVCKAYIDAKTNTYHHDATMDELEDVL